MKEIICLVSIYFLGSVAGSFSIKYDAEELGDPLILTPFIENSDIIEAQEKALVHHEEMANVKSYAGYVTIDKRYNSNMFFWYFPSHVRNYYYVHKIIEVDVCSIKTTI